MKFFTWLGKGVSNFAKLCTFTFKFMLYFCTATFMLSIFFYEEVANAINFFKNLF